MRSTHGSVNMLFEAGMYSLLERLRADRRICCVRRGYRIEVIGGVAVNAHLLAAHERRAGRL